MKRAFVILGGLFAVLVLIGGSCSPEVYEFSEQPDKRDTTTGQSNSSDSDGADWHRLTPDDDSEGGGTVLHEQTMTLIDPDSKEGPVAVMKTTMGDIKIQLFKDATPKTVENFVKLAKENFYDGTLFHRVIPDFMIQGGDPLTKSQPDNWSVHGTGGPGYAFEDEFNDHKNIRGRISMANSGPNTNGSQFFIITAESTPWLDGKHAVFGEVIEGMDVVDQISKVETNASNHPQNPVTIVDIQIQE